MRALTARSAAAPNLAGGLAVPLPALGQTRGRATDTLTQDDGEGMKALTGRSVAAQSLSGELTVPLSVLGQAAGAVGSIRQAVGSWDRWR